MEPNKEHLKLWVEDLESGKHKQVQGYLSSLVDPDGKKPSWGFCCLGRVCEVAIENGVDIVRARGKQIVVYNTDTAYPPDPVYRWLGLDPAYNDLADYATLNDEGSTFEEIAAKIREDFGLE